MALADLHFGYERHRGTQSALLPQWGMDFCHQTLLSLIEDYHPQRIILVGDVMDGSGSVSQTGLFLDDLKTRVHELVLIEGNHDRSGLKKGWPFIKTHREKEFIFHHGHQGIAPPSDDASLIPEDAPAILITGHEHPAISLRDGAGLKLKIPALVQQRIRPNQEHWILPAFSPWAAGSPYASAHERIATWVCSKARVWKLPDHSPEHINC